MTLKERNTFLQIGIIIAVLSILGLIAASFVILPIKPPVYRAILDEASRRAGGLLPHLLQPAPYAAFAAMCVSALYALLAVIFIYYFFEQTQAPEILSFAFFVISFAFETSRVMIPIRKVFDLSSVYLIIAERSLLFGRFLGIFSLFTASIYASGLNGQRQKNNILLLIAIVLLISIGIPIDGFSWDTSLTMISGYPGVFRMVELSIALITLASFLVAVLSRGNKEYMFVGVGALLVFLGRNLLINADTYLDLLGAPLLGIGTWFICTKLHRVYLWL